MKKSQGNKQNNTKLYFDDTGDAKSFFFLQFKITKQVRKKWPKRKGLHIPSKVEPHMKVNGKDHSAMAMVFKNGLMALVMKESGL